MLLVFLLLIQFLVNAEHTHTHPGTFHSKERWCTDSRHVHVLQGWSGSGFLNMDVSYRLYLLVNFCFYQRMWFKCS